MLTDDESHGYYHFDNVFYITEFDKDMTDYLVIPFTRAIKEQVDKAHRETAYIDMYVNSYGGETHLAFHLVSMMEVAKAAGVIVRTIVTDTVMSSGSIVSVAGSKGHRYVAKDGSLLVHYGYIPVAEVTTPLQAQRNRVYHETHFDHILRHYNTYCDIPDLVDKMQDDNYYITGAQAKRWGMADHFLDKFDLSL
jgi:ATP-dependent protease ClpP protease subunit